MHRTIPTNEPRHCRRCGRQFRCRNGHERTPHFCSQRCARRFHSGMARYLGKRTFRRRMIRALKAEEANR